MNSRSSISWTAAALLLVACASGGPLLNSDRIERQFGSYGVEILSQDESRRESSLYSGSGDGRVTRTWALVEYLDTPRNIYREEHEAIVAGASIGETFRRAGWTIRKQNLFIGELEVPGEYRWLGERMRIALPAELAVHQYLFVISRDERSFSYARITEVHHPDYLDAADLGAIYGEIILDDSNRDSIHDFIGPPGEK
jgi:hypothetical protein